MLPWCLGDVRIQLKIDHSLRTATQELRGIFPATLLRDNNDSCGCRVDYATPLKPLSRPLKAENLRGQCTCCCKKYIPEAHSAYQPPPEANRLKPQDGDHRERNGDQVNGETCTGQDLVGEERG